MHAITYNTKQKQAKLTQGVKSQDSKYPWEQVMTGREYREVSKCWSCFLHWMCFVHENSLSSILVNVYLSLYRYIILQY